MKRALIFHRFAGPVPAGDCYLPLSLAAELQKSASVVFVSNGKLDLGLAARAFGIPLDTDRLEIAVPPPPPRFLPETLRSWIEMRNVQRLAKDADICICTSKIADFGRPGHHFICTLNILAGRAFYDYLHGGRTRTGIRRTARRFGSWICENVAKPLFGLRPLRKIMSDPRECVHPNSRYVENILRDYFGPFRSEVFFPPTTFETVGDDVPRDPLKVVCVGRMDPDKRIPDIVDIVARARELSGADFTLDVAGPLPPPPRLDAFLALADRHPWLRFVGPVHGREKETLLLSGTFAVHARRDEEFGIAVTEYLKAGLVPVVPAEGGAAEVVDAPGLSFRDNGEAARILARLAADAPFREEQRRLCAGRALLFSRTAYLERQNRLLRGILERVNAV